MPKTIEADTTKTGIVTRLQVPVPGDPITSMMSEDNIQALLDNSYVLDNSIRGGGIAPGSITAVQLAASAVTEDKLDISNAPGNGLALTYDSADGLTWARPEAASFNIPWSPVLRSDSTAGLTADFTPDGGATSFRVGQQVSFAFQFYASSTIALPQGDTTVRGNYFFDLPYGSAVTQRIIGRSATTGGGYTASVIIGQANRLRVIIDADGPYNRLWTSVSGSYFTTSQPVGSTQTIDVIQDNSITSAKLAEESVTEDKLDIFNARTIGQVLGYTSNGLEWITPTTASVGTNSITTDKLADNAVTAAKIANGTITSILLANDSVNESKLAMHNPPGDNQVITYDMVNNRMQWEDPTTVSIGTGSVATINLADNAVTNAKVADDAIDTDQLADDAVTSDQLASNAVVTANITNANITEPKMAVFNDPTIGKVLGYTANQLEWVDPSTTSIADESITTGLLQNDAVTEVKLAMHNNPSDNQVVTWDATNTRMEWGDLPSTTGATYSDFTWTPTADAANTPSGTSLTFQDTQVFRIGNAVFFRTRVNFTVARTPQTNHSAGINLPIASTTSNFRLFAANAYSIQNNVSNEEVRGVQSGNNRYIQVIATAPSSTADFPVIIAGIYTTS